MTIPHELYVGTIGEGLWRSRDGGATFARDYDGLFVECHIRALAIHPHDDRILYLGSEQGLFRSVDGANTWAAVEGPLQGRQVWSILVLEHDPETMLVGTCPSRLFRSGDGGRTWEEGQAVLRTDCPRIMHTRVTVLAAEPGSPDAVWAGVEIDGLRRSRDRGRTWERVGEGLSSQDIHGLVMIARKGGAPRMLASTNNDLNESDDGGLTWRPLEIGNILPWPYCRGLAQNRGQPERLYLGNGDGPPGTIGAVARSDDGGSTWRLAAMPGRSNSTMWNFAVHRANPQLVYASSVSGEVYRSTDGGDTWVKLPREFGEIRALAWTPRIG